MMSLAPLVALMLLTSPVGQDSEQDPVVRQDSGDAETHRLNAGVLARLEQADMAEAEAQARYESEVAAVDAAIAADAIAHDAAMAQHRAEVAAWEARQARWRDQVAACEAGNRAACAGD